MGFDNEFESMIAKLPFLDLDLRRILGQELWSELTRRGPNSHGCPIILFSEYHIIRYHMNRLENNLVELPRFLDKKKYDQLWFEYIYKKFLFLLFLLSDSVHKSHDSYKKIRSELQ